MLHHFADVTELCAVCWVRCQGCVFPCIVNSPQCVTVAVGCPVKRPGDVSCLPKHYGMWHTVCWPIKHMLPCVLYAHSCLVQDSWRLTVSFVWQWTSTGSALLLAFEMRDSAPLDIFSLYSKQLLGFIFYCLALCMCVYMCVNGEMKAAKELILEGCNQTETRTYTPQRGRFIKYPAVSTAER